MSGFLRSISKITTISCNPLKTVNQVRHLTFLPKALSATPFSLNGNVQNLQPTIIAAGPTGTRFAHMKSAKELVEFLTEEIIAEKKAQNIKSVPTSLDGFNVNLYGADVELVKQIDGEKIIVSFNVNHTVDADDESQPDMGSSDKPDMAEMRSKPTFEVDIIKGNTTLSFTCSFLQGEAQEGEYNDVFGIDELCIFEGEWNEKVYAVAGDVLDGYLYDLLMNLLEEKGISNEFAEKLADFSTAYEHSSYITFLESLSKFTTPVSK